MTSPSLDELRARMRDLDCRLLRALSDRARFPRDPYPIWPANNPRLPAPPLAEILLAIAPAGTAATILPVESANRELAAALVARQQLAAEIAAEKCRLLSAEAREAIAFADRERLLTLLTDLATELRVLDFIRVNAVRFAPDLPDDLASLLWREYIIPWTKQSELDHLLAP